MNYSISASVRVSRTENKKERFVRHEPLRWVIVAKFFDKGNSWHCFFLTFDSLKGKETWKNGQGHYHYISDKFFAATGIHYLHELLPPPGLRPAAEQGVITSNLKSHN